MYEYDVFISYRRAAGDLSDWVKNHFHRRLSEALDNNFYREVKVFFDDRVRTGGNWPATARAALQRTRVLVPVCSPKYFKDEWCLAEWQSMAARETLAGETAERPTLIYPVIYCDSWNFPPWAHERRMKDLQEWNFPYEHFQASPAYLEFHQEIGRVAKELEELIERAPEWRGDWPVRTPVPDPPSPVRIPRF